MTLTAVLFPGQGSQTSDMREQVERVRPDLLELACAEAGEDPFGRADEGTRWAQPAIYCASLAGWERLREGCRPAFMAGHSLGEVGALAAAGALSAEDGLRVVCARGRLMQDAAGDGAMVAVLGGCRAAVREAAARHGLTVANDNAPGQAVLSGPEGALDAAVAELDGLGLRARRLPVGGAFHSPAMEPAVAPFRELLEQVEVRAPAVPVLSCVTGEPFGDVRELLARALISPVRWVDVLCGLHARGARRFVETGPGRVLTGLVRRTLRGVDADALRPLEAAGA
jgi:malonyl CoA-acyl carrier protein transacylase